MFIILKDMKKGVFPIIKDETHTTSAATTWGDDTTKEVGVIKVAGAHGVTFDSDNYPGEPGDCVLVQNSHSAATTVTITPDPFGDAEGDAQGLAAGSVCTVLYHPVHKWVFFGGTGTIG